MPSGGPYTGGFTSATDTVLTRFIADGSQHVKTVNDIVTAENRLRAGQRAVVGSQGELGQSFDNLSDRLHRWRMAQVQEQRAAHFYAHQLTTLLPIQRETAAVIGDIVGHMVGGFGLIAAFEVGASVVRYFAAQLTKQKEEAQKAREELDKLHERAQSYARESAGAYRGWIEKQVGGPSEMDVILRDRRKTLEDRLAQLRLNEESQRRLLSEKMGPREYVARAAAVSKDRTLREQEIAWIQETIDWINKEMRTRLEAWGQRGMEARTAALYGEEMAKLREAAQKKAADDRKRAHEQTKELDKYGLTELQALNVEYQERMRLAEAGGRDDVLSVISWYWKRRGDLEQKGRDEERNRGLDALLNEVSLWDKATSLREAGLAKLADHEKRNAYLREANGDRHLARELETLDRYYGELELLAAQNGQDMMAIEAEHQAARHAAVEAAEIEHYQQMAKYGIEFLQAFGSIFVDSWMRSWNKAATVNRRFSAEYERLSHERREADLLEKGIAETAAEAHVIASEEAAAAAAAQTAQEKEAQAERLAGMAIEYGIKAAVAAVEFRWEAAGVYAAAAVAAGAWAASLHAQAVGLTQRRGFTAEERDQLYDLEHGGGTGGARRAGGEPVIVRETVVLFGGGFMTEAEVARYWERARREAQRLDLARRVVVQ